jgi:hypothetical protein
MSRRTLRLTPRARSRDAWSAATYDRCRCALQARGSGAYDGLRRRACARRRSQESLRQARTRSGFWPAQPQAARNAHTSWFARALSGPLRLGMASGVNADQLKQACKRFASLRAFLLSGPLSARKRANLSPLFKGLRRAADQCDSTGNRPRQYSQDITTCRSGVDGRCRADVRDVLSAVEMVVSDAVSSWTGDDAARGLALVEVAGDVVIATDAAGPPAEIRVDR